MSKKSPEDQRRGEVESAIRSLHELFPEPRYGGCKNVRTRTTIELEAKIAARKEELANDAKLLKLEQSLKEERSKTFAAAKAGQAKVAGLLRRLQLRGATEDLIKDIEKVAASQPLQLLGDDCE